MYKIIFYITLLIFVFGCSSSQRNIDATSNEKKYTVRYNFVHKLLPDLFFSNPEEMIDKINQQGYTYFKDVLNELHKSEDEEGYNPSDIDITKIDNNDDLFLLIKLPHPNIAPEAYYISMSLVNREPRYFVLEKLTPDINNKPDEAVFCEWDKSGEHLNYGVSIEGIPTKTDFMYAINAAVNDKLRPVFQYKKAR